VEALIVGLGNPGVEYAWTRHNIGAHIVHALAKNYGLNMRSEKACEAYIARKEIDGVVCTLAIPKRYMNESGVCVQKLLKYTKCELRNLLVAIDDVESRWGVMKLAFDGGARGHNGLRSIHGIVGSREFTQCRFGVGHPGKGIVADYVLNKFEREEMEEMPSLIEKSISMIEEWIITRGKG